MDRADVFTSEVIYLKPKPTGGDEANKNHFTYFMVDGAKSTWVVPKYPNGMYYEILTREEREVFEKELKADLSFTMRNSEGKFYNPFWANFSVSVIKDDSLMANGRRFNMADPIDNLSVRVLRAYNKYPFREVALSKEQCKDYPDARWYLTDDKSEVKLNTTKELKLAKAYTHFGKINDSAVKMLEFLRLYGATNNLRELYDESSSIPTLITKITKIINDDLDGYIEVANDGNMVAKLFIEDAVACGAILKKDGEYRLKGGDAVNPVDPSLMGAVEWYINSQTNPSNSYTVIKSKVEKYRSNPK